MKETLVLKDFTLLFLATLANNSDCFEFYNYDKYIAVLPVDYKQRIQNILCTENGWKKEFSPLINLNDYFKNHFIWEHSFSNQIKEIVEQLGKSFKYNIEIDCIEIQFTKEEVERILSAYKDEELNKSMEHFTALLTDYIYSRNFQEEFDNFSAQSVKYMKKLKNTRSN